MRISVITDSCCDLPYKYIEENNIEMISLTIIIDEENKKDTLAKDGHYEEFYQMISNGTMPKTSQANSFDFKEVFLKHCKAGNEVIYIGFSSALSGCINSALIAKEEVEEEMPEAKIAVVDSKCASMGQGLLIYYAIEAIKEGKSLNEVVAYIEDLKLKINHWFTVSDLNHLFRGGRVSKTAATVGTLLQIKPIMHVDDEGRLIPIEKVKGRKKALKVLVEKVKQNIVNAKEQVVFISHGAALEEAEAIKQQIMDECHVKDVWINYIGAAVGSHAGPGTIAIFFVGENREV